MLTFGLTPATAGLLVVMTFKPAAWPSTVTKSVPAPTDTPGRKPVPETEIMVPFGPDVVPSVAVAPAAVANETSGAAIAINRRAVSTGRLLLGSYPKLKQQQLHR